MWLIVLAMWLYNASYGQLLLDTEVQKSQYANPEKPTMVLVDFWATWCGPCIYAAQYLNDLQQMFPDQLYIVSLSNEDLSKVKEFIKKHPIGLNVSIDDGKSTFEKFNVQSLPYSVLLDASGKVIWSGNPTNLKPEMVRKFSIKYRTPIQTDQFVRYNNQSKDDVVTYITEEVPEVESYAVSLIHQPFEEDEANIEKVGGYTIVQGGLKQILAYLLMVSPQQIKVPDSIHKTIKLVLNDKAETVIKKEIVFKILSDAGMHLKTEYRKGKVLKLDFIGTPDNWWDKNTINWGSEKHQAFLVSDDHFQADNIDFESCISKLSALKGVPIVVNNNAKNMKGVYDWDIHYKYYDLMAMNLDRLGILSEIVEGDYPIYTVDSTQ